MASLEKKIYYFLFLDVFFPPQFYLSIQHHAMDLDWKSVASSVGAAGNVKSSNTGRA